MNDSLKLINNDKKMSRSKKYMSRINSLFSLLLLSTAVMAETESAESKVPVKEVEQVVVDKGTREEVNSRLADIGAPVKKITLASVAQKSMQRLGDDKLKTDSIDQAMASAYTGNPQIKEQRAAVRALDERIVQAKAGWRPSINATASFGRSKQTSAGDAISDAQASAFGRATKSSLTTNKTAGLELRQNLFNGGATVYSTKSAKDNVEAARANLLSAEQQVLLAAVTAYLDLITKYAELEVLYANENVLKVTLQATTDKFTVGEETRTSVAQAQGQYAEAMARRQTAEAELAGLKATFERTTGRSAGMLVQPTLPKAFPVNLAVALDLAKKNNPDIIKAQFDESAARHEVDRLNSGLLPKVDFVGSARGTRSEVDSKFVFGPNAPQIDPNAKDQQVNKSVQVEVTIPLYEAGAVRSQKREATQTAEQRRIAIETQRRTVFEQLTQAWESYQAAKTNAAYYNDQVRANEISLDGTQQELQVGSKILLDVLNAQSKLLDAQLQLVRSERAYYLAAYRVAFFTGNLTAKAMSLKVDYYNPEAHYQETVNRF